MCGRYSLFTPESALEERFGADAPADYEPRYNCAPGQDLPVVAGDDPDRMRRMTWGLTPSWADEPMDLVNARVETVADKRSFADAYESRRCLVPADGFYEWSESRPDGTAGDDKRPYRVAFDDDRPFAMAGLYERWTPPARQSGLGEFGAGGEAGDTEAVESFTVLTTEPNAVVSPLHHRMAVVLRPDAESDWLSGELGAEALRDPYADDAFRAYPVSTRVNSPANDDPSLVEPADA
ncbi:SOS response-associated peptidase [Candidatus Halobonum tyrrellensis]|uniref:SOS response-associated peptidase n=1 Tax=Candidatus Halobonum tyrrellensis G22 TaxID=1324957 RepID=V4HG82_9EURY|nr:SOS response-associated peptidase [Candidatus Halobonum tyrrellensis]ESP89128.1 hypothetical protein K933_05478 [Candidatus Halobonum tyrrellensis G22]